MTGELDLRGRRAGPAWPEGLSGVAREPGLYGQRAGPVWPEGLGLCGRRTWPAWQSGR